MDMFVGTLIRKPQQLEMVHTPAHPRTRTTLRSNLVVREKPAEV